MASNADENDTRHVDPLSIGAPATSTSADAADSDARVEVQGASVHAVASILAPHSTSGKSDRLSELMSPPLLSTTQCQDIELPKTSGAVRPPPPEKPATPPLSPVAAICSVRLCALSDAVELSAGSFDTFTPDPPLTQRDSKGEPSPSAPLTSASASSPLARVTATEDAAALFGDDAFSVQSRRAFFSVAAAPGIPRQTSPVAAVPSAMCDSADSIQSQSCSSNAAVPTIGEAVADLFHHDPPLALSANAFSRASNAPLTAEASSSFNDATVRSLPTSAARRLSNLNHASGHAILTPAGGGGGEVSAAAFDAVPLATAANPSAMLPVALTSEHLLSSFYPTHGLSQSSGFFQSGLFLALEDDADTPAAAMDAPMTPQSYSNLVHSRSDSPRQSLMSSRHLAAPGGDGSSGSTTNAAVANVSVGSACRRSSQRGRGAAPLSENEGWAASETTDLRAPDENADGVVVALQQWEVNGGSCGGSCGSRGTDNTAQTSMNTSVAWTLCERHGLTGGPTTSFGSIHLMGSHAQPCTSAVDPADIPSTPTDLANLPYPPPAHAEHRRGRHHGESDDDDGDETDSRASDQEDTDAEPEVVETNTLLRARAVSADGRSSYEVINEKYVLYDLELGKGSYSRVHLCYCLHDKCFYAAKVLDKVRLKRRQLGSDYDLIKMDQEITIMKQLQHKNITGLHEVIRDPNARYVFLILELAECKEVLSMKDNGDVVPMANGRTDYPEATVRHLVRGVLHALMYAHYLGIAHRDVKPSNVLTTAHNTVKLCDFGVAVLVGESTMQLRREGSVAFLAPELLLSSKVDVSRFVSLAQSTHQGSRDTAESGEGIKSDSLPASASNAATTAVSCHATELMEEVVAGQDSGDWESDALSNPLLPSTAPATFSVQQQQQLRQRLVSPTVSRQVSAEFSEGSNNCNNSNSVNMNRSGVAAAASASTSGFPPLAAVNVAPRQRSRPTNRSSLRTSSLSLRASAAVASSGTGAASQYASWLSNACPCSTVDLFKGDVFSLGVTVFTLLMGRLPWRASSASSQLAAVLDEPDPFLRLYKQAYGDGYTWPPATQEAYAPFLAFTLHSAPHTSNSRFAASRVGSYGCGERYGSGRSGDRRGGVTPLETRAVSSSDDDDDSEGGQERSPSMDPVRTSAPRMPVLTRAGSLDAVTTAPKNTSLHSSHRRSSKAGCTPDTDLTTTTTLSGTVSSRSPPCGVAGTGLGVAVDAGSPSLPPVGSDGTPRGPAAAPHVASGQFTPSSLMHSMMEGNVCTFPTSAVPNELPSAGPFAAGARRGEAHTRLSSSPTELPRRHSEAAPEAQHAEEGESITRDDKSSPAHRTCQHPLPPCPSVAERVLESASDRASATATANTHTYIGWMSTTATYHQGRSGAVGSVDPERLSAESRTVPPTAGDAGERVGDTSLLRFAECKGAEETERRSVEAVPTSAPPPPASSTRATSVTAHTQSGDDGMRVNSITHLSEAKTEAADEDHATIEEVEGANARSAGVGAIEDGIEDDEGARSERSTASATALQSAAPRTHHEEVEEENREEHESDSDHDESQPNVPREGHSCSEHYDATDEEEGGVDNSPCDEDDAESDGQADNGHAGVDGSSDDENIYEQLYEEGHPCRYYAVAETCPLPALGGEGGTRAISAAAVDFVRACLSLDPVQRRTVFELFHHPWISGVLADGSGGDELSAQDRSHGASSFTDEDDGDKDDSDAHSTHRDCPSAGQNEKKEEQEVSDTSNTARDAAAASETYAASRLRHSPASSGVPPTSLDGSCLSAANVELGSSRRTAEEGERALLDSTARDVNPVDVETPRTADSSAGVRAARVARLPDGAASYSASADATTALFSGESENVMMTGTNSTLAATATMVTTASGSELGVEANSRCPLRNEVATSASPATVAGELLHSPPSPDALALPMSNPSQPQALVVFLCQSTNDLLETLTVQRSLEVRNALVQPPPVAAYDFGSSNYPPFHHARQLSSASSRHRLLSSPYGDRSSGTTSPSFDLSVTATPLAGTRHHDSRQPSCEAHVTVSGSLLRTPVTDETADRLVLSAVSQSSHSTTTNSNSVGVGGPSGGGVCDLHRTPRVARTCNADLLLHRRRRSDRVTALRSRCTVGSSSAATPSCVTAQSRPIRAATTSHVDSLRWSTSSDRHDSSLEHVLEELEADEGKGEGDSEELSAMTGSLPELLTPASRTAATSEAAEEAPSSPTEGKPPWHDQASSPPLQPHEEGALAFPLRRFLEEISLHDKKK
ncbi:putative protein kinase [Leptomonas pyrrhocoris]|uniref:non-specific serine/threonine protein kinase n=1 Tax=Leptomonas pyrrhocoris TaxID=157538 RepID=A0A0M9G5G5_LEPPY|nr:putative protein kinase [Leptomonas pyrrhocoris]KPA82687.1 putative protein kinase [Leptomonas pyrrhocoris]|eukprot:XP_015661126.1 putative protein kinase [Leptomonas pyrrhocoris]